MNLIPASILLSTIYTNFVTYILPIIFSYSEVGKNMLMDIFDVIMQQDIIVKVSCGMLVSILIGVLFLNVISFVFLWMPTISIFALIFGTYALITKDYFIATSFLIPTLTFFTIYLMNFLLIAKQKKSEDFTLKWMKKQYPTLDKKDYLKILVTKVHVLKEKLKDREEKINMLEREVDHLYKLQKTV